MSEMKEATKKLQSLEFNKHSSKVKARKKIVE